MAKPCPVCSEAMRVEREFYSCVCGCRVHASHFDRIALLEPERAREPPTPTDRREASRAAHDAVMAATEIITRLSEAGLIDGNADHYRQRIAELTEDLVFDNWVTKSADDTPW